MTYMKLKLQTNVFQLMEMIVEDWKLVNVSERKIDNKNIDRGKLPLIIETLITRV